MIGYFPQILRDELLYAVLARHRRHMGATSATLHLRALCGRRSAIASFDLPCALDDLSRSIGIEALDARTLVDNHSLLPYYAAFRTTSEYEEAVDGLKAGDAASVRHRLGLSAWSIRPVGRPRICERCVRDQFEELGEFTLLRSHQLPGTLVCHFHETPLLEYAGPLPLGSRHDFILPRITQFRPVLPVETCAEDALQLLVDVAKRQARLLQPESFRKPPEYREGLARLGFMRSAKKVDQVALATAMENLYRPILRHLPPPARALGSGGWPEILSRPMRKAAHPLLHAMFATFIERCDRTGERGHCGDPRFAFGDGPWPCRNPLAHHRGQAVIRDVKAYRNKGALIGSFQCICGYVYTRGISRSGALGPPRFREGGPLLEKFLRANVRPGATLRGVAKQVDLDPKTVVRLAQGFSLDFDWTTKASGKAATRRRTPVSTRATKRTKRGRICSGKPRIDWPSRDRELIVRLRHAAKAIIAMEQPTRVSFAELERRVARPGWLHKRRRKLPRSARLIDSLIETTEAFRRRRILLAAAADPAAPPWQIMRTAGVGSISFVHEVLRQRSQEQVHLHSA